MIRIEDQRRTTRRLAAYHEAGHAVAGCFRPQAGQTLRVTIRRADLEADDAGAHWSLPQPGATPSEAVVRASAVVSLAAVEVDRRLTGAELTCGSADYEAVRELLFRTVFDREIEEAAAAMTAAGLDAATLDDLADEEAARIEERFKHLFDELRAEAASLVSEKWPHIEAVADALLRRGSLDGDAVREIVAAIETNASSR